MRRRRPRRGIILLIVLSLLTLFTLLLVTFILVAGQYREASVLSARVSRADKSPEKTMHNALLTLVRDTEDPQNPIRAHALLTDMYGVDGFLGEISSARNVGAYSSNLDGTSSNFFDLRLAVQLPTTPRKFDGSYYQLSMQTGYYNGCVLSVVSGPRKGRAFRIVGYQPPSHATATAIPGVVNPTAHVFRVMSIPSEANIAGETPLLSEDFNNNGVLDPGEDANGNGTLDDGIGTGDRVVVNGRPFNGTGFGYNAGATPKLDPAYALQPNRVGDTTTFASFVSGDADEGYDAVDFQNMALAGIIPVPAATAPDGVVVIPSFHRPAMINYWISQTSPPSAAWNNVRDGAVMRPMPWNHPDFDGSNPSLSLSNYTMPEILSFLRGVDPATSNRVNPWDVDNDGDRIADSVWLDLGFPPQATSDGKLVKPLFAILCIDLDGRININAAGNSVHLASLTATPAVVDTARNKNPVDLASGTGSGPAEINLGYSGGSAYPLFTNAQYTALLESRYGADNDPGVSGYDTYARVKQFEYPANWFLGQKSAFGSPADLFGELAVASDHWGQPFYFAPRGARPDMLIDNPYEFDLSSTRRDRDDRSFKMAELERLLRYQDRDVRRLPERLSNIIGNARRSLVTTDSFDLPIPHVASPPALRSSFQGTTPLTDYLAYQHNRPLHVTDLLAELLSQGGVADASINTEIAKMLSPDLIMGTRMDVNRPFGNARDDNNNNVVDEHGPHPLLGVLEGGIDGLDNDSDGTTDEQDEVDQMWTGLWNNVGFDHDNDASTDSRTDAYLARHLFARHLFVLAMTLKDSGFDFDTEADPDLTGTPLETANLLAQWAVNVVDFRDVDSIMTAFEYDANPFNGWSVDGNIATNEGGDRQVVWGCERPELLISETLAFHDRRTEDLPTNGKVGDPGGETGGDMVNNFDQRLRPRGSLFVELYNPWSGQVGKPAEFYSDGTTVQNGIVLNKRAPINANLAAPLTGAPVWRMIVVGGASHNGGSAPLDPDDPASGFSPAHIDRGIYFTDPSAIPATVNEQRHWSNLPINPVEGGRFAVVGSGEASGSDYITTIGRRTDAQDNGQTAATTDLKLATTRRIVLTAPTGASPPAHQVRIYDNGAPAPTPPNVQPAVAAVINQGGSLSISEPPGGYTSANWDAALASGEGAYTSVMDTPLDDQILGRNNVDPRITNALRSDRNGPDPVNNGPQDRNAYSANVRTIHLQRLANPLLPWNPLPGEPGYNPTFPINPYRTVDRSKIDLTVFEGVYDPDPGYLPALPSPRTNNVPSGGSAEPFGGRERGTTSDRVELAGRKLWNAGETTPPTASYAGGGDAQVFNYFIDHTLGYLNDTYGNRFNSTDPVATRFFGGPKTTTTGTDGEPFPWLQWSNRPFVSQHELMLVPRTSSFRLLEEFSLELDPTLAAVPRPFSDTDPVSPRPHDVQPGRQFGHLMNFFASSQTPNTVANLYRLFDFTHVPSRFVGTETWLDPNVFSSATFGAAPYTGTELFRVPFNRVSTFRDPGAVNINTAFSQRTWDALRGFNGVGPNFNQLVDSRRGYGSAGASIVEFAAGSPTFFSNPVRGAGTGDLVPLASMVRDGVECTLLRSNSILPSGTTASTDAFLATAGSDAHDDGRRNPQHRYREIQRLTNMVTTRSNVYAVWITMGMFEVTVEETSAGSGVFVERLGQEAGRDTGDVKRHRAFYVIDRSIPVAFQPGQDHNVDRAIILKRFIE